MLTQTTSTRNADMSANKSVVAKRSIRPSPKDLKAKERRPGEKTYSWTVTFTVDAVWVADGFDLTDQRALEMLSHDLRFANIGTELAAKVIRRPGAIGIMREQGVSEAKIAEWAKK